MEDSILYFEESRPENMDIVMELVKEKAQEKGARARVQPSDLRAEEDPDT